MRAVLDAILRKSSMARHGSDESVCRVMGWKYVNRIAAPYFRNLFAIFP